MDVMPLPAVVVSFLKMARLSKKFVLTNMPCIITIIVIVCIELQEKKFCLMDSGKLLTLLPIL